MLALIEMVSRPSGLKSAAGDSPAWLSGLKTRMCPINALSHGWLLPAVPCCPSCFADITKAGPRNTTMMSHLHVADDAMNFGCIGGQGVSLLCVLEHSGVCCSRRPGVAEVALCQPMQVGRLQQRLSCLSRAALRPCDLGNLPPNARMYVRQHNAHCGLVTNCAT